ncbi:MAG: acyl-CoA thioesterase [Phycisphaerales bacterium]|nr:MAG: acyl-CoA thioesterase [Phycisphaerales bacterium]
MEGSVRVRVRYCECDPMGYVHHSVHPVWMEIARTETLRASGVSYKHMESQGVFLVVAHLSIDYKRPARYDDEALIKCRVTGTGRAKLEHAYELWRNVGEDGVGGELFATARTVLACVGADGRPRPLPDWLTAQRHG